jgi:CRISPR-associated RAMP protein (TIGR02581 family)
MHKKLLNEATFHLVISVQGPLLVKSGTEGWDPTIPDMQFVRTHHAQLGETVFIPGSSLKGTLRSYSEKIARTLDVSCCDPFDKTASCSKQLEDLAKESNSFGIYARSCVACKLFGSTNLAGRAAFADAYPTKPIDVAKQLTKRTAVAIDRVLGSVAVGPFDFEALMSGEFQTHIRLRNFELWQLGLLGLAVRDLCLGRIKVGYGKSRGFGSVSARLEKLELRSIAEGGLEWKDGKLSIKGIGALLGDEAKSYGINEEAERNAISVDTDLKPVDELLGSSIMFERKADSSDWCAPEAASLFSQCVKSAWNAYVKTHKAGGQHG